MIGAIIGDIIGSRFEFNNKPIPKNFNLFDKKCSFTDDTILNIATADAILNNKSFKDSYYNWGNKYPNCSYGNSFYNWLESDNPKPYNSFGNGSAMRVISIGWLYDDLQTVLDKAEESAKCTHNHIEGVKGACAVAMCTYLARYKVSKKIIKELIETYFEYDLNITLNDLPKNYFSEICQDTVPYSIICFLDSDSYEETIKNTILLNGDTDTMACISGGIAEAYYGLPKDYIKSFKKYIEKHKDMVNVIKQFTNRKNRIIKNNLK